MLQSRFSDLFRVCNSSAAPMRNSVRRPVCRAHMESETSPDAASWINAEEKPHQD